MLKHSFDQCQLMLLWNCMLMSCILFTYLSFSMWSMVFKDIVDKMLGTDRLKHYWPKYFFWVPAIIFFSCNHPNAYLHLECEVKITCSGLQYIRYCSNAFYFQHSYARVLTSYHSCSLLCKDFRYSKRFICTIIHNGCMCDDKLYLWNVTSYFWNSNFCLNNLHGDFIKQH